MEYFLHNYRVAEKQEPSYITSVCKKHSKKIITTNKAIKLSAMGHVIRGMKARVKNFFSV